MDYAFTVTVNDERKWTTFVVDFIKQVEHLCDCEDASVYFSSSIHPKTPYCSHNGNLTCKFSGWNHETQRYGEVVTSPSLLSDIQEAELATLDRNLYFDAIPFRVNLNADEPVSLIRRMTIST